MSEFTWQAPPSLDLRGTIADLMLRGPDALAQAAVEAARARAQGVLGAGQAQAQGTLGAGQAWGQGIASAGQAIAGGIQQATDPTRKIEQMRLQQAQDLQKGQQTVDTMMRGDQLPAGDQGPRQDSFLTPDGLFDVPKMTQALAQSGHGHLAPDLLKGAEAINDSILKHQTLEKQASDQQTILFGDMASGVKKLVAGGMPLDQAIQFVSQPALATQRVQPQQLQQITQHLMQLPPGQQDAALTHLMDAAAAVAPKKTIAKDAIETDRYDRTTASNIVPEKPTEASLAADLSSPDPAVRGRAQVAMDALKPKVEKPPRPLDQQLLEAIASGDATKKANILATIAADANAKRDPVAQAQLESIRNLTQQAAQDRIENENPQSAKNQQKFEQEYRTVLQRGLSSRSGGLGLEDAKVQQANHLMSIFEQNYDPKTGEWNIPRVQLNELALGLARLTAPGGQAGEGMLKEFQQRTAKGDLAGALTYLTGAPVAANTQAITQMLKDSIERQGRTALTNREGEMAYLRGLAPTDLSEDRRQKLEATSLNPLRQSRVASGPDGQKKLFVSTDGGKTWQ